MQTFVKSLPVTIFKKELALKVPAQQQSINIANKKGLTPLDLAVKNRAVEFIDFLVGDFIINTSRVSKKYVQQNLTITNENYAKAIKLAQSLAEQDKINAKAYNAIARKLMPQYCALAYCSRY